MNQHVPAKQAMRTAPVILDHNESIQEAAAKMYHMQGYAAPVLNGDRRVIGSLSNDSLMTAMMKGLSPQTKIADIMERQVTTVHEKEVPLQKITWNPSSLPVVNDEQQLTGMLYPDDWLFALETERNETIEVYQSLLNAERDALFLIDANEMVVYRNRRAADLFEKDGSNLMSETQRYELFNQDTVKKILNDAKDEGNYSIFVNQKKFRVKKQTIRFSKETKTYVALRINVAEPTSFPVEQEEWKEKAEKMKTVIELAHDGIIMVDKDGIITMLSQDYADFLEVSINDVVGKHVTDVIEHTRMHIVAKTGKPEIADIQPIKGDYMVATRLPIYKDGKLEGAVGKVLFKNLGGFKALKKRMEKLEKELSTYRGEWQETNRAKYQFNQLIGKSQPWTKAKNLALKAASTESNVLLLGESGTGKELFAHAIHNASTRSPGAFVKVNCAAIPSDLIESELFGYVEGSFTGAKRGGKKGKFEAADGGTIFLDEIGELPIHMQVKLLRVLQEREVEKVGATVAKPLDIRVVAATNRNLEEMIAEGDFRLDLFYRLNVFSIQIPSLRSRPEDIDILVPHFLKKLSARLSKEVHSIDRQAMTSLLQYDWPGNTRELENVIERTVNVVDSYQTIQMTHLPEKITGVKSEVKPKTLDEYIREAEEKALHDTIKYTKGNKSKAAKLLGISRTALYEKIAKYE
ncbi:sigma-54-dependent Fis family transcriptional regulator [Salipaludibacillus keqinensis]|uniref:Sigma-54-dependent Fis family transcriptional regulator n=1 Tax=Salipaludibacillus keqinensis TaxID=2045207 RepID=A0A323TAX9_9BACI|nr:sigma 54-interacting transcriptional regulator [Salipaludibacillus keqinensis]PYZ91684.1 sigma-54-dependent Fis family transcriptional regulator [Salipaludibacillus keqinensis]